MVTETHAETVQEVIIMFWFWVLSKIGHVVGTCAVQMLFLIGGASAAYSIFVGWFVFTMAVEGNQIVTAWAGKHQKKISEEAFRSVWQSSVFDALFWNLTFGTALFAVFV